MERIGFVRLESQPLPARPLLRKLGGLVGLGVLDVTVAWEVQQAPHKPRLFIVRRYQDTVLFAYLDEGTGTARYAEMTWWGFRRAYLRSQKSKAASKKIADMLRSGWHHEGTHQEALDFLGVALPQHLPALESALSPSRA